MVDQRLVSYIRTNLSKRVPLKYIKQSLLKMGWSDHDITAAMNSVIRRKTFPIPPRPPGYKKPAKKFSKIWILPILIIVIISIILIFLMTGEKETAPTIPLEEEIPEAEPTRPTNCGTNLDCLIEASKDCSPAKVTHITTVDLFGMRQTTTSFLEIKGLETGKCIFYIRTENVDIEFSNELVQQMLSGGATQEEITQQEQEANAQADITEGLDGTCKFNTDDLTAMLNRWKIDAFSTEDWAVAECEGEMFSQ